MDESTKQIYDELHNDTELSPEQVEADNQELPFADITSYEEE